MEKLYELHDVILGFEANELRKDILLQAGQILRNIPQ